MCNLPAGDSSEPIKTCPPGNRREGALGPAKLHKQGPEPRRPRTTAKTHSSLPSPVIVSVSALESFCSAARPSEAGLGSVHREAGMELIIIHIHLVGDSRLLLMEVVL